MKIEIDKKLRRLLHVGFALYVGVYLAGLVANPLAKRLGLVHDAEIVMVESIKDSPMKLDKFFDGDMRDKSYDELSEMANASLPKVVRHLNNINYNEVRFMADHPLFAKVLIDAYKLRNGVAKDGNGLRVYSFRQIHEDRIPLDCSEATVIAAAALYNNGYRPLSLTMNREYDVFDEKGAQGHEVFLYKKNGKFGFVGINRCSRPKYDSVDDIVRFLGSKLNVDFTKLGIYDFSIEDKNWITTDANLQRRTIYRELK